MLCPNKNPTMDKAISVTTGNHSFWKSGKRLSPQGPMKNPASSNNVTRGKGFVFLRDR